MMVFINLKQMERIMDNIIDDMKRWITDAVNRVPLEVQFAVEEAVANFFKILASGFTAGLGLTTGILLAVTIWSGCM